MSRSKAKDDVLKMIEKQRQKSKKQQRQRLINDGVQAHIETFINDIQKIIDDRSSPEMVMDECVSVTAALHRKLQSLDPDLGHIKLTWRGEEGNWKDLSVNAVEIYWSETYSNRNGVGTPQIIDIASILFDKLLSE